MAAAPPKPADEPKLLWNPENVKDVAESVGIGSLNEEALKCLSQDVEYRLGQVIIESLRFMRHAGRTTLTVQDVSQAMKVLDVEPLYGYESTRPLRYGEASLGPGQPLFYIEDEEVDFEKLINAPLPKVPRDATFTAHWLAIEGVQPTIPQNPTTAEARSQELVPKGPGANPALAALAGNDNVSFRPHVRHVISKELVMYFEKIQSAILDDNPDDEVRQLRNAALQSVRSDPGLHQLVPYFVNFIANQVTHRLDDTFTLRQMMELTAALIANDNLYLDPYASPLSAPVLTCLMSRKLGTDEGLDAVKEQYELRELSAAILGNIAKNYGKSNTRLRPKLTRTCLKYLLDPSKPAAVLYGAVCGLSAAGGPESVRVLLLPNLKSFDDMILRPMQERGTPDFEIKLLLGAIVNAIKTIDKNEIGMMNGVHSSTTEHTVTELTEFLGETIGREVANLGSARLNRQVLDAKAYRDE
ncbi:transcription initiation factor tfiid subunit 6 [Diaporthe amygdali]|uniref:transcription initiation factor tfiid subunit 6 n=1 Tax=Phomopsis amygdali TaxID=1214568 RepID=UPI0022FE5000|nr:transcription initiation factor tfiid subunit 6 [Diaporthe amygdali]KAJ0116999.1 transcription initiation factor tfiid subunit 6 [Diaporthe amygdali]